MLVASVSLNNLANLYSSVGRYMEAEPLYTEALGMARELLGSAHPDIATFVRYLRVFSQGQK
ncbi:MAG: tetratricopeptide repeat protein [Hormoscilla sp. GUM202]|nr:tetratricopeptide repeat protein [Hormoscilla sp. GUM202]